MYRYNKFVNRLYLLDMDNIHRELRCAVEDIINILQQSSNSEEHELCATRLEILSENALLHSGISLEIVDFLNHASCLLKKKTNLEREFESYEAPLQRQGGRGRPRFLISEEQLLFFKGTDCFKSTNDQELKCCISLNEN